MQVKISGNLLVMSLNESQTVEKLQREDVHKVKNLYRFISAYSNRIDKSSIRYREKILHMYDVCESMALDRVRLSKEEVFKSVDLVENDIFVLKEINESKEDISFLLPECKGENNIIITVPKKVNREDNLMYLTITDLDRVDHISPYIKTTTLTHKWDNLIHSLLLKDGIKEYEYTNNRDLKIGFSIKDCSIALIDSIIKLALDYRKELTSTLQEQH